MTLTCEDNNSKLVVIVTVADAENHFDDSLVQIWKLKFGHEVTGCLKNIAKGTTDPRVEFISQVPHKF